MNRETFVNSKIENANYATPARAIITLLLSHLRCLVYHQVHGNILLFRFSMLKVSSKY